MTFVQQMVGHHHPRAIDSLISDSRGSSPPPTVGGVGIVLCMDSQGQHIVEFLAENGPAAGSGQVLPGQYQTHTQRILAPGCSFLCMYALFCSAYDARYLYMCLIYGAIDHSRPVYFTPNQG